MCKELFDGPVITLSDMLDAREDRANTQLELLASTPECALLSATMNIPGAVKNSEKLKELFTCVLEEVLNSLTEADITAKLERDKATGLEFYGLIHLPPETLKRKMVAIEEEHPYGRLMDLDVLWLDGGMLHSISRQDLFLPRRKCFVCDKDAKVCGRSSAHSAEEMQNKMIEIVSKGKGAPE